MKFVCEASKGRTWFRIETDAEAEAETKMMRHAVEKHFRREQERARKSYVPGQGLERDIQLKAHLARTTPLFLTLRADDGSGLATAMLPPGGAENDDFPTIIVGPENADPYADHGDAIDALARHYKLTLPRARCYPYAQRG
ncbi:MAG: hypothetical protein EOP61_14845 [Sphingomonadales bacterium]|jgi:hypothetical protein|nr:MAG: hypothetical protein EOP61_14845 [Sphingomonadales bacterium]